jgi:CO/xanthine dehydrogenase FAD-binding subunit
MKPPAFDYFDPRSEAEALTLLAEHGADAKVLAGGQSLMPMLNLRLLRPRSLVDINRVASLAYIRDEGDELAIGSATRQRTLERSETVRRATPLLHLAIPFIAHFQIRNRGTIGGSLAHADPAAELPAIVTALGGTLVLRSRRGERRITPAQFFTGYLTTALAPDELLAEIRLPKQVPGTGFAFHEVNRRHGDFALAAAAAWVRLDARGRCASARVVIAGVHGVPWTHEATERNLVGTALSGDECEEAARKLTAELQPHEDLHASAAYRRQAARILAQRALADAAARAREGSSV